MRGGIELIINVEGREARGESKRATIFDFEMKTSQFDGTRFKWSQSLEFLLFDYGASTKNSVVQDLVQFSNSSEKAH
jgi:hypothetical protein